MFTDGIFGVFILNSLATRTLTHENTPMRSWMNDRYDESKAALLKIRETFSGSSSRFKRKLKKPSAATVRRIRASVAIGGFVLLVGSVGIAMGISTPGQLRDSIYAMVPASLDGKDALPPPATAGVVGYGEIVPVRELSLPSRASGHVTEVLARVGDAVREGSVLIRMDPREAERAIRDAETQLAGAELALARVDDTQRSAMPDDAARAGASAAFSASLDGAYLEIADTFLMLPNIVKGLEGMLYGGVFPDNGDADYLTAYADRANIENPDANRVKVQATERYSTAKNRYETTLAEYRITSRASGDAAVEALLFKTQEAATALSDAAKATRELHAFVKRHLESHNSNTPLVFQEYEDALVRYASQLNDKLKVLLAVSEDVRSARSSLQSIDSGTAPRDTALERKEAELQVRSAENALNDAKARLGNYEVKAPFDGIVAAVGKKTAQNVDDGETVATLITSDALAHIALEQGVVPRIRPGQKALVSIEGSDMQVAGRVAGIDARGEKGEDGITRFNITIALEKDDRIKPGMRVIARFIED